MSKHHVPDRWVIVKITSPEHGSVYKTLAGWYGGYLGSDSWQLSSGIVSVEQDTERNLINYHQSSGSVYVCSPHCYGFSNYTRSILAQYETMSLESNFTIEVMPPDFDVSKVCNEKV